MAWPFKILVKYASRGRPGRFFDGMDSIYNNCALKDAIRVLITLDEDDVTMNNDVVRNRIKEYPNTHVIFGKSENKIHATNRDMDLLPEEWRDWQIIANFSDDQRFNIYGWETMIMVDFNSVSPDFSHFMAYLDQDTRGALSTLYIAGRKWYDQFGFIYDPQFKSLFCDNLVEDAAKHLGKYHFTGYCIYQHLNPAYGHLPEDELFRSQQDIGWDVDQKLYYDIKAKGITEYLKRFEK